MKTAAPTLARMLGSWQLDPGVLVVCAATGGALRMGRRPVSREHWPLWRAASFMAGLLVLMTALCCPGSIAYSDELLSVHVVQHLLADPARAGAAVVGRARAAGAERLLARGTARDRRGPAPALGESPDAAGVRVRAVHDRGVRHPPDGPL